jgi:hypothetical protein
MWWMKNAVVWNLDVFLRTPQGLHIFITAKNKNKE